MNPDFFAKLQTNKELKSTKKSSEAHGLGHKIVKSTVVKYHGMVDYFESDEMFGVEIILPEKIEKILKNSETFPFFFTLVI